MFLARANSIQINDYNFPLHQYGRIKFSISFHSKIILDGKEILEIAVMYFYILSLKAIFRYRYDKILHGHFWPIKVSVFGIT